jgi:hypothetical protein
MAKHRKMKKQHFISRYQLQAVALFILYISVILKTVLLNKTTDAMGTGAYISIFSIVFILAVILMLTLQEVVGKAVGYRKSRNQYRNALKMMKTGALAGLVLGILVGLLLILLAGRFTNLILRLGAYGTFPMMILAISFPLLLMSAAMQGCFEGFGFEMPGGTSQIIFGISDLLLSLILVYCAEKIGTKHGNLLHDEYVVKAFGVTGAVAGFTGACILTAIWQLALLHAFRKKIKGKLAEDVTRNQESFSEQLTGLLAACGIPAARFIAFYGFLPVLGLLYFVFYTVPASSSFVIPAFIQYGKNGLLQFVWFLLPLGAALLLSQYLEEYLGQIIKKEDIYHAGQRIVLGVKQYLCFPFPIICIIGVLLKSLQESVFGNAVTGVECMEVTAVVLLLGLARVETAMLKGIGKEKIGIGCGLAAFLIGICAGIIRLSGNCYTVSNILTCMLVYALVFVVGCSAFLIRFCVYKKQLVRHLVMPVVATFAAVIAASLCMFLKTVIGEFLAVLLACVIALAVHLLVLLVTECIKEGETGEFPQGTLLLFIGKRIGIY